MFYHKAFQCIVCAHLVLHGAIVLHNEPPTTIKALCDIFFCFIQIYLNFFPQLYLIYLKCLLCFNIKAIMEGIFTIPKLSVEIFFTKNLIISSLT